MKLKALLLLTTLFTLALHTYSQTVNLKKDNVHIDGKKVLSFKKDPNNNDCTFYRLNSTDEVLFVRQVIHNSEKYTSLFFTQGNVRVESKGLLFDGDPRLILEKLLFENVLRTDGSINGDKLQFFFARYDDPVCK